MAKDMAEENYHPRGLGTNWHSCYICNQGGGRFVQTDMAAFVDDRESGERIVEMYKTLGLHPVLDYRENQPSHVQVKVGACEKHLPNLEKLMELCSTDKKINSAKIIKSLTV
jgi:hypothetical protein